MRDTWMTPVAICGVLFAGACQATPPSSHTETLVVSLLERPIGREVSTTVVEDGTTTLHSEIELTERGGELRFESTLVADSDLAPRRFTGGGRTYRFVNVDLDITAVDGVATVVDRGIAARVPLPEQYFMAGSWAPLAGRGLLVRYWERHGRPARLAVLPGDPTRDVTVEHRGIDTVAVDGREVRLRRYAVNGVVWGRESVWLDDDDRVAAVTSRIHIMALEGVREDLIDAWPTLQASDVADRMADLEALGARLRAPAPRDFALVGGRVIDGTGAPALEEAVIVVRDDRIAAVGPRSGVPVPPDVAVIDARGTTTVPGLWDLHAHASQIEWAPAYLAAGVTTIRDMGGEAAFLTAFRDAMASGRAVGPRLLLAGLVDGDSDRALGAIVAATPDQGRAVVDRYRAMGFDQVKLYSLLDADVARAIITRAHELGMTVTGHVPASLGLAGAVEAGMDQIAHLPGGASDLAELLASRRVAIDPTMPWGELLGRPSTIAIASFEPGIESMNPALAANYESVSNDTNVETFARRQARGMASVRELFEAGVPIVAGTDGAVPGVSLLRNLEMFVEAGMEPMEALQAATRVPARVMGLLEQVGTVEVDKRADLLVLDANPLDDIRNVRQARWVIANGTMQEPAALRRAAGFRQ